MTRQENNFSDNLKNSKNIAVIADITKGTESYCASVALSEIISFFLKDIDNYSVSTYFLAPVPFECELLNNKAKTFKTIGEKTLYIKFPVEGVSKVTYDLHESKNQFVLGLVGVKGKTVKSNDIIFKQKYEKFDMCVGVGYDSDAKFIKAVPFIQRAKSFYIFNNKNLKGDNLVEGVIDLYFNENIVPTKLASEAFFTFLSQDSLQN